jgi:hypothetical protein
VNCADRQDYPACPNPPVIQKYPTDPALFPDWRVTVETRDTAYRPLLILLVQILSSFAAYQLSYFAFEARIEIFGFALPMLAGPLVVLGSLVAMCHNQLGQQDGCQQAFLPAMTGIFFSCPAQPESLAQFLADNWIFILAFLAQVSVFKISKFYAKVTN